MSGEGILSQYWSWISELTMNISSQNLYQLFFNITYWKLYSWIFNYSIFCHLFNVAKIVVHIFWAISCLLGIRLGLCLLQYKNMIRSKVQIKIHGWGLGSEKRTRLNTGTKLFFLVLLRFTLSHCTQESSKGCKTVLTMSCFEARF